MFLASETREVTTAGTARFTFAKIFIIEIADAKETFQFRLYQLHSGSLIEFQFFFVHNL